MAPTKGRARMDSSNPEIEHNEEIYLLEDIEPTQAPHGFMITHIVGFVGFGPLGWLTRLKMGPSHGGHFKSN